MKILFAAQDPGGANALVPVIKKIRRKEAIKIFSIKFASAIFQKETLIHQDCTVMKAAAFKKEFASFAPDVIMTGTSIGDSVEKRLVLLAKKKRIPTISIIDFWSNYGLRFSDSDKPNGLKYLPDIVCVVDERMKYGCIKEGIPVNRIRITGNPYFAYCAKKNQSSKKEKNQILFISQPHSVPPYNVFPFDEFQVLRDLLAYSHINKFEKIIIKLHPKEEASKFRNVLFNERNPIPIEVKKTTDLYRLIGVSRLIFGMNSTALIEASLAGKSVISYQPGLEKRKDPLPDHVKKLYKRETLYTYLDVFLKKKKGEKMIITKNRLTSTNATADKIYRLLLKTKP